MVISQKVKYKFSPSNPTVRFIAGGNENLDYMKTCMQTFAAALFVIVKSWISPQSSSTGKWINKLELAHQTTVQQQKATNY